MGGAFAKDIVRSIRGSLGRFLAIMGIVALGCGFYAGLQMCGPNMRADADVLYDGTHLWDVRLISTMGFGDDDVKRVRDVEGVSQVMPSLTLDAITRVGKEQMAVRISSLDVKAAETSKPNGQYDVSSNDDDYLNRVRLVDGHWPKAKGECVISADVTNAGYGIGDKMRLMNSVTDLEDLLCVDELTIVGTVSSSNYPYTGSFGSTSLGSGMIGQYLYVSDESLAEDAPYTELYLTVKDAAEELSESDAYKAIVDATKGRLEGMETSLALARRADLKAEAQVTLDEKWDEYRGEKKKAESQLAEGKAKLDDARRQLDDGKSELADGEKAYADGKKEYESNLAQTERELADGAAEIARNQKTIDEQRAELASGKKRLEDGRAAYEDGLAQLLESTGAKTLDEAVQTLKGNAAEADDGIAQLQEGIEQIEALPSLSELKAAVRQASAGVEEARAGIRQCEDGIQETNEAIAECDKGIADAEAALTKLAKQQEETEGKLAELQDKRIGLASTLEQLPEDNPAYEPTKAGLADVDAGIEQAQAGLVAIEAGITEAAEGKKAAEAGKAEAKAGKATAEKGLAEARAGLEKAQEGLEQAQQGVEARESLPSLKKQLSEVRQARAKIDEGLDAASTLKSSKTQLDDSAEKLASGERQLADGQRQLDEARNDLEEGRATAQREFASAKAQLDDAATELADARTTLADGRAEYEDGLASYEEGKATAERELSDGRVKLEDAQNEIDDLDTPGIYALDRTQSEGAATYHADAGRIDNIAAVFPFMFFLVAALVALTTMTRMVEDDRVQIGTYKALGYGTTAIAAKYLVYAGAAGVIGATLGIVLLSQALPLIVMSSYDVVYAVPVHPLPMPIDLPIALAAGGLGVGVTLLATWGAVVSSLREVPATLMQPRAPVAGKRILLERITPVWGRLNFIWKVTCRNLFRYKRRLLMTVVGIAGCTALLLVGFGLRDSIWDIIANQYGPIIHFDTTIGFDDDATAADAVRVSKYLESTGEVSDIMRVQSKNMQAGDGTSDETTRVHVIIPRDVDEMTHAVTFHNRVSGERLDFTPDSVFVSEKIALLYDLDVGSTVRLYDQDDVGNAIGDGHELSVSGVIENYVDNYVYVGAREWAQVEPGEQPFTTLYATTTDDEDVRVGITEKLHDMKGVSTVVFSSEAIAMYRDTLSVVDLVVVVLIVSAAALAYIVLYNLTNINIGERVREIASIKVLGFTRGEVYAYIFREIALLAVMGDVLGMVLGTFLESFVVTTAEVTYVMFGRSIHPMSYVYAFVLTLVFTGLVIFSMRHKLDRVDMVESLKSVD